MVTELCAREAQLPYSGLMGEIREKCRSESPDKQGLPATMQLGNLFVPWDQGSYDYTHPPAHPEAGLTSLHQRGDIPIRVITAKQLQLIKESAHPHALASSPSPAWEPLLTSSFPG